MRVIHLARKPLSEGSIAANTLKHGTGGVNIDATRIGSEHRVNAPAGNKAGGESYNMSVLGMPDDAEASVATGRWPANVILAHRPECRCVGTRKVVTGTAVQRHGGGQVLFGGLEAGHKNTIGARTDQGFAGDDGKEEIPAWDCVPGCPVADLDGQSGFLPSRGNVTAEQTGGGMFGHGEFTRETPLSYDSGGASRFYKQVGGSECE